MIVPKISLIPQYWLYVCIKNLQPPYVCIDTERLSGQSKETGLVIYLAFLAKVANLYYTIMTSLKKYWPNIEVKFISGTQETFI